MKKPLLSVIVPGLNEDYMQDTITNILDNSGQYTEVICVLDGYWPSPGIKSHDRLRIIHNENPLGQRQATNQGVRLSEAMYVMKLDAHVAVSKDFDKELIRSCKPNWIMVPRMYTLDAFHWACPSCKKEFPQGPVMTICEDCKAPGVFKKMIWKKKDHKRTDYMWINDNLRMKYFDRPSLEEYGDVAATKKRCDHKKKEWSKGAITDVMTCIGAGFFMHRKYYDYIGGMDEDHGSWGQMAVELSMKAWLSGGRMVVNKNCWFAHLSRTGKGFGFPYKHKPGAIQHARKHSEDIWKNNKWPQAIRSYDWIVRKFSPLPGWVKEQQGEYQGGEKIDPPMIHEYYPEDIRYGKPPAPQKETALENSISDSVINSSPSLKDENLSKGLVYYTDNHCEERILAVARKQLEKCRIGKELISVSQVPIDFGKNLVINAERSPLTMFKQILMGIKESKSDIIFLCEHDVIYHPSHFEFTPSMKNVYYFNNNVWALRSKDGETVFYTTDRLSQMCGHRDLLLQHFEKKVKQIEELGWTRRLGYEPGKHKPPRGVDNYGFERFWSTHPNVDIKHGANLTGYRNKLSQFNKKPKDLVVDNKIPFWGDTGRKFNEWLKEVPSKS